MNTYLKLYSNCIPVRGASRQIICDLQRNDFYYIPLPLFLIVTEYSNFPLSEAYKLFPERLDEIKKSVDYLITNELAFLTETPQNFPNLEVVWDFPGLISNCIFEINNNSNHNFSLIFDQLEKLGCKYLEIRFYDTNELNFIFDVLKHTENRIFRNIDVYIKFNNEDEIKILNDYFPSNQRLGKLFLHSTPAQIVEKHTELNIILTSVVIEDNSCCGKVSMNYFMANTDLFMESKLFNSCLNRKISITADGVIKNCPSLKQSFGNVNKTPLKDVVLNEEFRHLWGISKDQISVCKDCEFRYICTDCRAFINDPNDILSKPSKCNYDPYSGIWGTINN